MGQYDTKTIEEALSTLWDESRFQQSQEREGSPDPDMPRNPSSDPTRSGTAWAVWADMSSAWRRLPLDDWRRAVFRRHAQDLDFRTIGALEGCSKDTAQRRYMAAIEHMRTT